MQAPFVQQLDALASWRKSLDKRTQELSQHLVQRGLDPEGDVHQVLDALSLRLRSDRLNVAFVAEFSRGKSELINAIFFADTGRRVLPATPGRTTMCPVEIGYDEGTPSRLALLPIETRLEATTLQEWRERPERWTHVLLDVKSPAKLTEALGEVMRTKAVTIDVARGLGLWSDDAPDDNPPSVGEGLVEVPAWRHAAINYPHPLLQRGLVVLDTPGLNAIGAEPELTLSLLPQAHAVVFILGADTGVTKSDLQVWKDHLANPAMTRLVALNKIDALADPLLTTEAVDLQIESQRQATAQVLSIEPSHVFPVSARHALTARVEGRKELLQVSRLPALEHALSAELLPRRHELLKQAVLDVADMAEKRAARRIQDQRVQLTDQLVELRGLRGKSGGKATILIKRVQTEAQEFEQGAQKVMAVRAIHVKMLRGQLATLASASLRDDFVEMQANANSSLFKLGARKAYADLFARLQDRLVRARRDGLEAYAMLSASFKQLNTEHGFSLQMPPPPDLDACERELKQLENNYGHYLGITNALKLSDKRFRDQFYRMLMSKLRVAFEASSQEVEHWHKTASSQLDSQLRDRRVAFVKRQESLERIAGAQGDLEARITELEQAEGRWQLAAVQTQTLVDSLRHLASEKPSDLPTPAGLAPAAPKPDAAPIVSTPSAPSSPVSLPVPSPVGPATGRGDTRVASPALASIGRAALVAGMHAKVAATSNAATAAATAAAATPSTAVAASGAEDFEPTSPQGFNESRVDWQRTSIEAMPGEALVASAMQLDSNEGAAVCIDTGRTSAPVHVGAHAGGAAGAQPLQPRVRIEREFKD